MSDIYHVLAKHFSDETTAIEEEQVLQFKKENPIEYNALKKFWESDSKTIEVVDFNTKKALKKIQKELNNKQKRKVIPLFHSYKRMAAAVILLIVGFTIGYKLINNNFNSETTVNMIVNTDHTQQKVLLADSSIVWLNKNATLSYKKKFDETKREVTLTGEGFFQVTKDKTRPFIVKVNTAEVTVLGTSFNIKEDSIQTSITVNTGKVNVRSNVLDKSVVVTPEYTAQINKTELKHFKTKNKNYLAWKTGIFEFDNTPFDQVIKDLNTYYETKLEMENNRNLPPCYLKAKFNNQKITEIIEIIKLICNVEIKKENNSYKIVSN